MAPQRHKPAARQKRRDARPRDDSHLMRLAAADFEPKRSTKARAEPVRPLNDAQRAYDAAMRSGEVVFGIGPAGTGKTWLAAMRAGEMLKAKVINKIIVTRPAVEAGENLGFLPGELDEKYEPYFRPVREALDQCLGSAHVDYLIAKGDIEARPLALLRGSSIDDAWIIADEMQNATTAQLKMLLTRGGRNTKFIVNGDPGQTDLPRGQSGLTEAVKRLHKIDGVETVMFTKADIVRSGMTQRVVEAFEDETAQGIEERRGLETFLMVA